MTKIAFIWDLDGTLLDSYEAILAGIAETFSQYALPYDKECVRTFILEKSVQALLEQVATVHDLDLAELNTVRAQSLAEKNAQVQLLPGSQEVLDWAKQAGVQQFVYTHKGDNAFTILEHLGLRDYFTEILTSQSGFARKPSPEAAHYLMDKYQLDPNRTYYIGDRQLDIDFAKNSGIKSINFLVSSYPQNQKISLATDIVQIFEDQENFKFPLSSKQ
ncbi:hydrolase, haloacid dehalogenase-like family [Streptococcus sp. DD10]|uniref:HAD-IA family hydrolase n=1 Tax=Streptococcus sp. DD10 TaxID=1777878 RepID=UPI0007937CB1|nr:HAD-IA family hydrolase [Streptococcus sp. DD10]KXT74825.1 hydrolase, haloacid dehalogenase-like family [Streptococcus sp. DD10]